MLLTDGVLSIDFQAEAREVARLHSVIDPEAEADGYGDEAGGGHDEQHAHFENDREQQPEGNDAHTGSEEDHGGAADVIHAPDGVRGIFVLHLALQTFDVLDRHAAREQSHTLLRANAALVHLGVDTKAAEAKDHEATGDGDDEGRHEDLMHGELSWSTSVSRHFAGNYSNWRR